MNFVHIVIIINQEMRIFYRVVLIIFVSYISGLSKILHMYYCPANQSAEFQNVVQSTAFFLNSEHVFFLYDFSVGLHPANSSLSIQYAFISHVLLSAIMHNIL